MDSYTLTAPRTPPNAPTGLTATAVSSSQIDLAWTDNADNETGFKIERSPDSATWAQIATVGANVRTYSNNGLSASTFFSYRVRAYNGGGDSTYSNVASTTTLGAPSLHVGDLDGSRTLAKKNWAATVTIAVHDASHAPVSGALVSGSWSAGASGSSSCTTNASGVCSVSRNNLKPTVTGVAYAVLSASKSGFSYLASSNHDADGSSNGTTITVTK